MQHNNIYFVDISDIYLDWKECTSRLPAEVMQHNNMLIC